MMKKSLELIHDVVINSGKISSIEISQDSIYLDFRDVELGTPKFDDDFFLTVRFASESFITISGMLIFYQILILIINI